MQHAEQLDLYLQRHLRDFVEKQGAAVRGLEASRATLDRAGEGSALVPEELGFDERRRHGRAAHGHERRVPAIAGRVDHARRQLLAGSALAGQQHGRGARRDGGDALAQLRHGRRAAFHGCTDPLGGQLGARRGQVAQELPALVDAVHDGQHVRQLERLGHVVDGGLLDRGHCLLDGAVGGHEHDVRVRTFLAQTAQNGEAIHFR